MTETRSLFVVGLSAAFLFHGVFLVALLSSPSRADAAKARRAPVKIRAVAPTNQPRPAPTPPALQPPPAAADLAVLQPQKRSEKPKPTKSDLPAPVSTRTEPTPKPPSDPPATAPAPDPTPALTAQTNPTRKFSVSLDAIVATGVAVPTSPNSSGWAFGAPDGDPNAPAVIPSRTPAAATQGATEGKGPINFEASEVTKAPKLMSQPTANEMRSLYPEDARKAGIEADVALKILIGSSGEVLQVKVLKAAGRGFDEVAILLVKRFRFSSAERDGQKVAVWIPWTYRFRLDG